MRGPIWLGLDAEQGGFEPAGLCASGWRVTLAITGKILHFEALSEGCWRQGQTDDIRL